MSSSVLTGPEVLVVKRVLVGLAVAASGLLVLRRRRAARDEQLLWDEAATSTVPRDLR